MGAVRQEAFTNLIYVGFGYISLWFGFGAEIFSKFFGLSILIHWFLTIWISEQRSNACFGRIFFTLCIPIYVHAFAGLETLLFSYLLYWYINVDERNYETKIFIAALLTLCRPEGIIFAAFQLDVVPAKFLLWRASGRWVLVCSWFCKSTIYLCAQKGSVSCLIQYPVFYQSYFMAERLVFWPHNIKSFAGCPRPVFAVGK